MDETINASYIRSLQLKNFRCLSQFEMAFDQVTCVTGSNGSGKTSILEALYYACYVRSFRAAHTKDLVQLGSDGFFIKIDGNNEIQAAFAGKKRVIKVNNKPAMSHKEIMDYYRVIGLVEDDIGIVQDGPHARRTFFDQVLMLEDPNLSSVLKSFKMTLEQRNALLHSRSFDRESYIVWTEQLLEKTAIIQEKREKIIVEFEKELAELIKQTAFSRDYTITFMYAPAIWNYSLSALQEKEQRFGRSLIGAHLDDIKIILHEKNARLYASRGQQKWITLLFKVAQARRLSRNNGNLLFFIDDFMTDFDIYRIQDGLSLLQALHAQLLFTMPTAENQFLAILRHTIPSTKIISI